MTKLFESRLSCLHVSILLLTSFALACGSKDKGRSTSPPMGSVEAAFHQAGSKYQLPTRMLMAVAYLESRLDGSKSSSIYFDSQSADTESHQKGLSVAETAFGLSRQTLNIDSEVDGNDIKVQIDRYGEWLSTRLKERNIVLPGNPVGAEAIFDWIWELAAAHRDHPTHSRNVQTIFAKEMIDILNNGFFWQDPASGDILRFQKEATPLTVDQLPQHKQSLFQLTTQRPEVDSAQFLRLGLVSDPSIENKPKHIYVIHCPFSLSACLNLQQQETDQAVRLEAHYVIPPSAEFTLEPLQLTKHHNTVRLSDRKGRIDFVTDGVVVMLTGHSGRIVDGYRKPGNPTWFTKWQLEQMGNLINDICLTLERDGFTTLGECVKLNSGVRFQEQGRSENVRWGDIPDFDPLIFYTYVEKPGGLDGETGFDVTSLAGGFLAGQEIPIKLMFNRQVKHIELERIVRCQDEKLTWALVGREEVRSENQFIFKKRFWDAGPNGNGSQYLRARVYGTDGQLIGWHIAEFFLRDFEQERSVVSPEACYQ
jgi:hypothetical protein